MSSWAFWPDGTRIVIAQGKTSQLEALLAAKEAELAALRDQLSQSNASSSGLLGSGDLPVSAAPSSATPTAGVQFRVVGDAGPRSQESGRRVRQPCIPARILQRLSPRWPANAVCCLAELRAAVLLAPDSIKLVQLLLMWRLSLQAWHRNTAIGRTPRKTSFATSQSGMTHAD